MAASSISGVGHKILNFENPVRIRMRLPFYKIDVLYDGVNGEAHRLCRR